MKVTKLSVGSADGATIVGIVGSVSFDAKRGVIRLASGAVADGKAAAVVARRGGKLQSSVTLSREETAAVLAAVGADPASVVAGTATDWKKLAAAIIAPTATGGAVALTLPAVEKVARSRNGAPKREASEADRLAIAKLAGL